MPTTILPESKEKAAEISRKIQNSRQRSVDSADQASQVSGSFSQKGRPKDPQQGADHTNIASDDGQ